MYGYRAESIDRIFNDDVRTKKNIAGQAKHRKRGSKSKKCSLSTDGMTKKQWTERCGEVMTYNLNKPIEWQEFCNLPKRIQREYLLGLIRRYSTTASDLAKMFGVTAQTVTRHCGSDEIGIRFSPGKRMTSAAREAFNAFLSGEETADNNDDAVENEEQETPCEESCDDVVVVQKNDAEKPETPIDIDNTTASTDMAMTEFTISFAGKFSREMLFNSILSMVPNGTNVHLDIKCSIDQ